MHSALWMLVSMRWWWVSIVELLWISSSSLWLWVTLSDSSFPQLHSKGLLLLKNFFTDPKIPINPYSKPPLEDSTSNLSNLLNSDSIQLRLHPSNSDPSESLHYLWLTSILIIFIWEFHCHHPHESEELRLCLFFLFSSRSRERCLRSSSSLCLPFLDLGDRLLPRSLLSLLCLFLCFLWRWR